jgi:predicted TIM-barrel fold metal-dependent hydrolase
MFAIGDLMQDKLRRVDCHVHYQPTGFQQEPRPGPAGGLLGSPDSALRPGWTDLGQLRQVMDATGVDLGAILTFPHHATPFRRSDESISDVIGRYNRALSDDLGSAGHTGFVFAASVDPLDADGAARQLERDLHLPYARGIALLTNYGDITLDDPRFEPIFELAEAFDVPCTVHPGSAWPSWRDAARLAESSFLLSGLGYFLADALCIFLMVHAGVFERHPRVRFMFCQLGGAAAICCGRWHFHAAQARTQSTALGREDPIWARTELTEVLSHVWLDTHTQDRHALQLVLAEAGSRSIVLGGDYPVTAPELGMHYVQQELDALHLPADVRRRIERDNALELLKLA